jgi:hypothetical protein
MPRNIAGTSTRVPASFRIGTTTSSVKFSATPPENLSFGQAFASTPAAIEPPETLETWSSFGNQPISLSRHRAPVWNSIAR